MANFYINAETFELATSIYIDIGLSTLAPDGFYSTNNTYRQQINGNLLNLLPCNQTSFIDTTCNIQGYVDTRIVAGCKLINLGDLTGYSIDETNSSFLITSIKNDGSGSGSLGFEYSEATYNTNGSIVIRTQNTTGDNTTYVGVDIIRFDLSFTKPGFPTKRIVSLDFPVKNILVGDLTDIYTTNIRIYN